MNDAVSNSHSEELSSLNLIERQDCVGCGSKAWSTLVRISYQEPAFDRFLRSYYREKLTGIQIQGDYELRECASCHLVWQAQVPDDQGMKLLYEQVISPEESLRKRTDADHAYYHSLLVDAATIGYFFGGSRPRDVRVLDFGMGWGHWCKAALACGYAVTGAELSSERIAYARQYGIEVCTDIAELDAGSFDAVNADQVLEHVPDPATTVDELVRLLRPGGLLKIAVPNGKRELMALKRGTWKPCKGALQPLEHINVFRRGSLDQLVCSRGLKAKPFPIRRLAHMRFMRRMIRYAYHRFGGTLRYYRKE